MRCCDCSWGSCVQKEIELTGGAACVYSKPADPGHPALISPAPDRASLLSPRRFIAACIGRRWPTTEGKFEMCSSERLNAAFKMQVREAEWRQAAVFLPFSLLVFRQFTLVSPALRLPEPPLPPLPTTPLLSSYPLSNATTGPFFGQIQPSLLCTKWHIVISVLRCGALRVWRTDLDTWWSARRFYTGKAAALFFFFFFFASITFHLFFSWAN